MVFNKEKLFDKLTQNTGAGVINEPNSSKYIGTCLIRNGAGANARKITIHSLLVKALVR